MVVSLNHINLWADGALSLPPKTVVCIESAVLTG